MFRTRRELGVGIAKSLARFASVYFQSVPKTLSKKIHLQSYLTQIVHLNSKMLFL